jgi:hypothetical protein
MINDYEEKLKFSENPKIKKQIFEKIHEYFVEIKDIEFVEDKERQIIGKDIIIHFKNGGQISIDLKIRDYQALKYNDIAIELYHIDHGKTYEERRKGWMKYSQCEYIMYVVVNRDYEVCKSYLLPFRILQKVITENYELWKEIYPILKAPNKTYDTYNIAIPNEILLDEICSKSQFEI